MTPEFKKQAVDKLRKDFVIYGDGVARIKPEALKRLIKKMRGYASEQNKPS